MIRYCSCGQPVLLKPRWTGPRAVPRYYDPTKPGRQPESISRCPRCGSALRYEALESRPPWAPRWSGLIEPRNSNGRGRVG